MTTTFFNYLYRDSDNYKARGTVALDGNVAPKWWWAALAKLEGGEFFVAEQLGVPPLYQALYKWSDGPTSADHCWHAFDALEVLDEAEPDAYRWGAAEEFVARLLAIGEWRGELSPHFRLDA
jgi:hypothetical protein